MVNIKRYEACQLEGKGVANLMIWPEGYRVDPSEWSTETIDEFRFFSDFLDTNNFNNCCNSYNASDNHINGNNTNIKNTYSTSISPCPSSSSVSRSSSFDLMEPEVNDEDLDIGSLDKLSERKRKDKSNLYSSLCHQKEKFNFNEKKNVCPHSHTKRCAHFLNKKLGEEYEKEEKEKKERRKARGGGGVWEDEENNTRYFIKKVGGAYKVLPYEEEEWKEQKERREDENKRNRKMKKNIATMTPSDTSRNKSTQTCHRSFSSPPPPTSCHSYCCPMQNVNMYKSKEDYCSLYPFPPVLNSSCSTRSFSPSPASSFSHKHNLPQNFFPTLNVQIKANKSPFNRNKNLIADEWINFYKSYPTIPLRHPKYYKYSHPSALSHIPPAGIPTCKGRCL